MDANQIDIPVRDTPALELIRRGYAEKSTDPRAVGDCQQLLRVSKRLLGFFYQRFAASGISPGKYSILCELLAVDGIRTATPSALAASIGVSRPTVTGLIEGLVTQGYVERAADPEDRRSIALALTDAGRDFIVALLPEQFDLMSEVIGVLSKERRRQLRGILAELEEHLR